jgi:hypothetical protein
MAKITFERKSETVVVAFIKKAHIDYRGKRFMANEAVRAILESGGWRIDKCGNIAGAWLPWEAIDQVFYPTLSEAKRAIRAYAEKEPTNE